MTGERLTAKKVERLAKIEGLHFDGGGLYLQVKGNGASWLYRYRAGKRSRYLGLGPLRLFGLADARQKALDAARQRHGGNDPIASRRAVRAAVALAEGRAISFKEAARQFIDANKAGWKNAKHAGQWLTTLENYAYPIFGGQPVAAIDTGLVLKVLEPIWSTKSETASRLRGRIESILDWATVRGYREGANPARWKGHLDQTLPARGKVAKVEHHAALAYGDIGAFTATLRTQDGTSARALEFLILTAARTGEVIGATWGEIDLAAETWTIPAHRMKAGREHRVPLAPRAIELLKALRPAEGEPAGGAPVFQGATAGKPLSNMSLLMLLRRMKRADLTAHGFRSTFRDWAAEQTSFPAEVAEMALAHAVGDKVEAAYRRGDLFEKRRQLATDWSAFCATVPAAKG